MDMQRTSNGYSVNNHWIFNGQSMNIQWLFKESAINFNECSMDFEWIFIGSGFDEQVLRIWIHLQINLFLN